VNSLEEREEKIKKLREENEKIEERKREVRNSQKFFQEEIDYKINIINSIVASSHSLSEEDVFFYESIHNKFIKMRDGMLNEYDDFINKKNKQIKSNEGEMLDLNRSSENNEEKGKGERNSYDDKT